MTGRSRRLSLGLVLLGLALVYPAWLAFVGAMASRTTRVDAPLVEGRDIDLPVHVAWPGRFSLRIIAKTTHGADRDGDESCLLDLPDPHSQPMPCVGVADRLHLNFRLENRAGEALTGDYGVPMAGRYQDRNREYGPFVGDAEMGNELLILEKLERGDYRLLVTAVHVPDGLAGAAPRILLERQANTFGSLTVLPLLALSIVLGLAGLILLALGVATGRRSSS